MALPRDPLSLDISKDLKRVDNAVSLLLNSRTLWDRFLIDPNGVLVELGLHPITSPAINERANRIFYATLTNKRLLNLITSSLKKLQLSKAKQKKYNDYFKRGLVQGRVQHHLEYDFDAINFLFKDQVLMKRILNVSLSDLNEKGILEKRYTSTQIRRYIDQLSKALQQRKKVHELPKLESWDRNYGVAQGVGALVLEVGVAVTAAVAVEAGAAVTAVAAVEVKVDVGGEPPIVVAMEAVKGSENQIRALATLGRLIDFGGMLLEHAHNFEKNSGQ